MPTLSQPDTRTVAIIGGSGLYKLDIGTAVAVHTVKTPFADAAVTVTERICRATRLLFVPRHGENHVVAPHQINYRANLWALKQYQPAAVIAVNSVGGITPGLVPGRIVIPDQLIDYTHGRESTFAELGTGLSMHVEFTQPYDSKLVKQLASAARFLQIDFHLGGVYGCTQGPRLETAAEIRRMMRDGCDVVGMTGMPEAVLARELELPYACLALVVNRAAGCSPTPISLHDIEMTLANCMADVQRLLDVIARNS